MVDTSQINNFAIRKVFGEIAGPVQALFGIVRISNELLLRELVAVQVSARDAATAHKHLSRNTGWHQPEILAHQVNRSSRNWPSDVAEIYIDVFLRDLPEGHMYGSLCDAVHVNQLHLRVKPPELTQLNRMQLFAS